MAASVIMHDAGLDKENVLLHQHHAMPAFKSKRRRMQS